MSGAGTAQDGQRAVYEGAAAAYDRLVSAEDVDGRLRPALEELLPLAGARVIEVGAGTGRMTRLLVEAGARVIATERAAPMARFALGRGGLGAGRSAPALLALADARALPLTEGWADLALAAWVFGHLRYWLDPGWEAAVGRGLDELERALRPGGTLVVIETLGTGRGEPAPPSAALAEYYRWLEEERGLLRRAIRTDYSFPSVEDAARTCGFFFGEELAALILERRWRRVPECTGIWWRRLRASRRG